MRRSLLLCVAVCSSLAALPPQVGAVKLHRCDLGAERPLRCGRVDVPLRRADPTGGTTEIAFAVRPRGDRDRPSLGAVLAVDGGPGYASTAAPYVRSVAALMAPLLRRRELVFVDQRGTGLSGAIRCDALQRGRVPEFLAVAQCAEQLGPRYAAYTTSEAAADLDAVRAALDLQSTFLYGDSYGTLLGQAYAVRYPQRLRGLILDSAYPADDPYYRTLYPAGIRALRIACRRSSGCSGDPVERFRRVVRRFDGAGRSTESLLSFLLGAGTLAPRSYLSLDDADSRFLRGRPRRLNRLLTAGSTGHGDPREYSYGMAIATECNDYPLLWDRYAPMEERIRQLDASVRGIPRDHFAPFGRADYLLSSAAHLTSCLSWPAPPPGGLEPPVPAGWRAPATFPTLVLAGQLDDVTSPAEARQVVARFPRSRLYVVPNRGHASSIYYPFASPAVGVIRAFVRSN